MREKVLSETQLRFNAHRLAIEKETTVSEEDHHFQRKLPKSERGFQKGDRKALASVNLQKMEEHRTGNT